MEEPTISLRELRNDVSSILRRVEGGERFVVTVSGRPVAEVVPLRTRRPRFIPLKEIQEELRRIGPDPELYAWLREGMQTTDDIPDPWERHRRSDG